ncbi:RNA polymerase, sigma-24 subunit, ECF subfamily [Candidatus Moduliflexus flocculans]|uniref:RNA polymerase, sigma-24 subunit, ECF subfamily n=1 Tax=Candidatus Moduliflexus flocculans TaxID=1499966 RepID=A0A081BNS2_9BACT|nr:RNA polymerase, sigma-24 subunit, ECF subfamily [Candidatus Moduliflexus flocculans]
MLTDEQLIRQLQQGKTRALEELYRRYAKPLYLFCAASTRASDPEDIVHDVFARVIEAADRFNPQKALFRTWLFTIARNRCIDLGRREEKVKTVSLDQQVGANDRDTTLKDLLPDGQENVEQRLARESEVEAVRDCISRIQSDDERKALLLYYTGEKVFREIGEILGKSTSMAKNYVTAAQEKVKRCLERKGF